MLTLYYYKNSGIPELQLWVCRCFFAVDDPLFSGCAEEVQDHASDDDQDDRDDADRIYLLSEYDC